MYDEFLWYSIVISRGVITNTYGLAYRSLRNEMGRNEMEICSCEMEICSLRNENL